MQFKFDELSQGEALVLAAMCDDYLDRRLPAGYDDSLASGLCMYFKAWLIAADHENVASTSYCLIDNIRDFHLPAWKKAGESYVTKQKGVCPIRDRFVKAVQKLAWSRV